MKKLLSWLLILAMLMTSVLLFAACDDDDDENDDGGDVTPPPAEQTLTKDEVATLLSSTGDKMAAMTDFHIAATANIKVSDGASTVEMPFTANVKVSGLQSESLAFSFGAESVVMGESTSIGACYKDGWAYAYEDGEGIKRKMSVEEIVENVFGSLGLTSGAAIPEIPAEAEQLIDALADQLLDKINAVTLENGTTELSISITVTDLVAMISDMMDDVVASGLLPEEALGEMDAFDEQLAAIPQMLSGSASIVVTLQNNYITKLAFGAAISVTMEGTTTSYEIDAAIELVNPGEAVTVTLPEGVEDFEDMSVPAIPQDPDVAVAKLEAAGYTVNIGDPADNSNYKSYTVIGGKIEGESITQITVVYCDASNAEETYEGFKSMLATAYKTTPYDIGVDGTIVWYTIGEADLVSVFN